MIGPNWPRLLAACRRRRGARLVIAKLDRLSRNVAFIATLMDSNVEFIAVDNPHATRLTLHILAAVAEHEREMISKRTSAALQAAKARGKKLGRYGAKTLAPAHHAAAVARAEELRPVLVELAGKSTRQIATELTARGIPTQRGGQLAGPKRGQRAAAPRHGSRMDRSPQRRYGPKPLASPAKGFFVSTPTPYRIGA